MPTVDHAEIRGLGTTLLVSLGSGLFFCIKGYSHLTRLHANHQLLTDCHLGFLDAPLFGRKLQRTTTS
jgi:hypothetical protein